MPDWSQANQRIRESVESRTSEGLKHLKLKEDIGKALRIRTRMLWTFLVLSLGAGIAGGVCSFFQLKPWDLVGFGTAGVSLLLLAALGNRSVNKIRRLFSDRMEAHREKLQLAQREAFRQTLANSVDVLIDPDSGAVTTDRAEIAAHFLGADDAS